MEIRVLKEEKGLMEIMEKMVPGVKRVEGVFKDTEECR